jgi:hypothetical protein
VGDGDGRVGGVPSSGLDCLPRLGGSDGSAPSGERTLVA